jgi:hypothetical protein
MPVPPVSSRLSRGLLHWGRGFGGAFLAVALGQRLSRFLFQRFVLRLVIEALGFALVGFLTQRLMDWLGRRR